MKLLIMQFPPVSSYFSPLSYIIFSTLFSNILSVHILDFDFFAANYPSQNNIGERGYLQFICDVICEHFVACKPVAG
jgi:hypothetical protein